LRSTFGSSSLVRLLGTPAPAPAQPPGMDFAERLSLWLNAFDAIGLQAAHQSLRSLDAGTQAAPATNAPAVGEDLRRVRSVLAKAVAQPVDTSVAGYAPWHQRHQELQRQMEMMIAPLREHVRQAVSRVSPRLRQLAVLDAAFGQVLARREQALLPKAATLLRKRCEQQHAAGTPAADFAADWQQALLAELDLRLEPVAGLVEALDNELKNRA
jgi:hypothetical protein